MNGKFAGGSITSSIASMLWRHGGLCSLRPFSQRLQQISGFMGLSFSKTPERESIDNDTDNKKELVLFVNYSMPEPKVPFQ